MLTLLQLAHHKGEKNPEADVEKSRRLLRRRPPIRRPTFSTLGLVWDIKNRHTPVQCRDAAISTDPHQTQACLVHRQNLRSVGPRRSCHNYCQDLRLCKLKTKDNHPNEWNRPFPPKLQEKWKRYHATIKHPSELWIPCFVSLAGASRIHIISNASQLVYGACCYVRSVSYECLKVQLMTSMSMVASLVTKNSIARLKLSAAVLSCEDFLRKSCINCF